MASSKNTELSATELELKRRGRRRLIGAITMGLLAIVFLPMIFDSEPKRDKQGTQEISVQVPSKEGQPALPAPAPAPTAASAVAPPAVAPEAKPAAPAAAPIETKPAVKTEPPAPKVTVAPKPTPEVVKPSAPAKKQEEPVKSAEAKGAFVVQLGAFRDADNAQQLATRMKEAKLPVKTDIVATSSGKVTRVRVGPYATREQADSALVQVKLAGADGKIVPAK